MSGNNEQDAWVLQVLGFQIGAAAPASSGPLLPIWIDAKEKADTGISKLQDVLRGRDDEDLDSIVEFGLYGATTGEAVRLMAALREADAKPSPDTFKKLTDAVENYQDFLDGAPIVDLLEENPFGVSISLRGTLGPALAEIARRAAA